MTERLIKSSEEIVNLFKDQDRSEYDFSQAPTLITRSEQDALETELFQEEDISRWSEAQTTFMRWTKDEKLFTEEYIERNRKTFDEFFADRGALKGNVLDIGGGWGLYRQWWDPLDGDVFIVHDPGVERFLQGLHELHHVYYERALSFPMTFVEGFGEDLPYDQEVFNTYLIASALDHCIDPERVFAEAFRCLKPGGEILIVQHCEPSGSKSKSNRPHVLKRSAKYLKNPQRLFTVVYERMTYESAHLHHFQPADITALLETVGFSEIQFREIKGALEGVYAFEAAKA